MLLPHYQENKDDILDGQRVYEDIAFSDSYGRVIYAIPDGSYLLIKNGKEELRGEAYRISEGKMSQISRINDIIILWQSQLCSDQLVQFTLNLVEPLDLGIFDHVTPVNTCKVMAQKK